MLTAYNKTVKKLPQFTLGVIVLMLILICSFIIFTSKTTTATSQSSCGTVNNPIPSWIVSEVAINKPFYTQVSSKTGVPWEMLAAIHYRETNFSHTNPWNGQGIFQFVNGNGGPYPAGPVSDTEFVRQLTFMATAIQNDYVFRNAPNSDPIVHRKLTANESNYALIQSTLFSYNGRSSLYASQASTYGYDRSTRPYEGSPYVMNMFDCTRSSMGIITKDFGGIDGNDTRFGAFTLYARLKGESYWKDIQAQISNDTPFFQISGSVKTYIFGANKTYYSIDDYERLKDYGFESSFKYRVKQVSSSALTGYTNLGVLPGAVRFEGGIGIFLAANGTLRPFPSEDVYINYGYSYGSEAYLPKEMKSFLPEEKPVWRVAGESDGYTTYFVTNGKKQALCNQDVYTKLGTPIFSSQSITSLPKRVLDELPTNGPIAIEGDIIEGWGGDTYGVWHNSTFTPINSEVAKKSGAITCGAPADAVSKLPKANVSINNLASDSTGQKFVIEGSKKLLVNTANVVSINKSFIQTSDVFLDKLETGHLQELVRVDGGIGVYVLKNGKSYGIPSEADLIGLGYNFSQVKNISKQTFNLFTPSGLIHKPGKLLREAGTLGVYITDNQFKKHPFTSEEDFLNYGFRWSEVEVIPKGSIPDYASAEPASIYVKEDDGNYWLIDKGVKRRLNGDLPTPSNFNLTNSIIITLPASVLSNLPMSTAATKVFRASNDKGVYMIENGKKRVFASESALLSRGFTWNDVRVLAPHVVNTIPAGLPLF